MVTALSGANGRLGEVVPIRGAHDGDELAGLGEEDVRVLGGREAVDTREVGNEKRWECAIARTTFDVDIDTVLVHLTVSDLQSEVSMVSHVIWGWGF